MAFYLGDKLIIDPEVKLERRLITQAEYDVLSDRKDNILYVIVDAPDKVQELKDVIQVLNTRISEMQQALSTKANTTEMQQALTSISEMQSTLDLKANVADLSNVLAEEVNG